MRNRTLNVIGVLVASLLVSTAAVADAPLKSKLDLDMDQAKAVAEIQAEYRKSKRSVRQELNRESRKLRRARSANDSQAVAEQEEIVARLEGEMRELILSEDDAIRGQLTPTQLAAFEDYLDERNDMVGSSRDVRVLD